MKIDSHHHFWNYTPEAYPWIDPTSALKRDYGPQELAAEIAAVGIDGVVSVQARQSLEETRWLCDLANQTDWIQGVVGWVPLAEETLVEELERLQPCSNLKAVRHVVQDEPDDAFILGEEFNHGISQLKPFGLVYDILIFAKHLKNSIKFVDRHPEQSFVLDHIGKPTIQSSSFDETWEMDLRELAKRENVVCKFSGVATEVRDAQWNAESIHRYWDVALDAFGPSRLMFGSDWPVCRLKVEYQAWYSMVEAFASKLSWTEQAEFWGGTATRTYGLASR